MQIYILFSSSCPFKFNKNSKKRCYLLHNSTNNVILVPKVRTNTEKRAWIVILTNIISRGEKSLFFVKIQCERF